MREVLHIHPQFVATCDELHLRTPTDFFQLPGEIISGHPDRHVVRVLLGDQVGYLKREHRIPLGERWKNYRAGFGWVGKSAREARVLAFLEAHHLPGPGWWAWGYDRAGRGFLLIPGAGGLQALTHIRLTRLGRRRLARRIADVHNAGLTTPDLTAKHILTEPTGSRVVILDWQRSRFVNSVDRPTAQQGLAALHATIRDEDATGRERCRFLRDYLKRRGLHDRRSQWFPGIRTIAKRLLKSNSIRLQRCRTSVDQRLVWLDGEALCVRPAYALEMGADPWRACFYPGRSMRLRDTLADGTPVLLTTGTHGGWRARLRLFGKHSTPELRTARLLFHLERHGFAVPKLIAFGHRRAGWGRTAAFVLHSLVAEGRPIDATPTDRLLMREWLRRLHQAGCRLRQKIDPTAFRVTATGEVVLCDPNVVEYRRRVARCARRADVKRLHRIVE